MSIYMYLLQTSSQKVRNHPGFSIVELIVAIIVIGILSATAVISYSGINKRADVASLKSDLDNAANQLAADHFSSGTYPATAEVANGGKGLAKSSPNITYQYTVSDGEYCLSATSSIAGVGTSHISSGKGVIEEGYCVSAPTLTASSPTFNSINLSWTAVSGATNYILQRDTVSGFTAPVQIASQATTTFTSSGLSANTTYYYRVNVTIPDGTSGWSTTANATTNNATLADTDPTNWIAVGTQVWARANVSDGNMVGASTSQTDDLILQKYCPNSQLANCTTHGGLYQWNEAMQYTTDESAQGVCPVDSHIPSDQEWKTLEMYLGMTEAQANAIDTMMPATYGRGTDQGTQVKEGGGSGLNMKLAGMRNTFSMISAFNSSGYYWTSTLSGSNAYNRNINASTVTIYRMALSKSYGYSVRCAGDIVN